jgi:hypothetical protein
VIYGGDAELDRVEVLVGEVDAGQNAVQERGLLCRDAGAAIGETLAAGIGFGQFVFVIPGAVLDQVVYVGAIGPLGVAEDAERGGLQVAAGRGLMRQRVLADEIHLGRFVGPCCILHHTIQKVHQVLECVAEDRAKLHQHVDARPLQFGQRD